MYASPPYSFDSCTRTQCNRSIYHWDRLTFSKRYSSATAIRNSIFSAPHSDGGFSRHRDPLACDEFTGYDANHLWRTCHSGSVYDLACGSIGVNVVRTLLNAAGFAHFWQEKANEPIPANAL